MLYDSREDPARLRRAVEKHVGPAAAAFVEGRSFATGGSFTVGGSGGPDSQFMPLWLTPGEQVDVRRPGANDNGEIVSELRELRKEVAELRSERARDTKADQAQRAAIYEGTAGLLDGSNERLDRIKRAVAR